MSAISFFSWDENRYVRFTSIDGIPRRDLPIAVEVWLDDIAHACWVSRDVIKIATLFARYISRPNPDLLKFNAIERATGMEKPMVAEVLRTMTMLGVVEEYTCDGLALRAALHLSFLQRMRVLEIRARFNELSAIAASSEANREERNMNWLRSAKVQADGSPVETLLGKSTTGSG